MWPAEADTAQRTDVAAARASSHGVRDTINNTATGLYVTVHKEFGQQPLDAPELRLGLARFPRLTKLCIDARWTSEVFDEETGEDFDPIPLDVHLDDLTSGLQELRVLHIIDYDSYHVFVTSLPPAPLPGRAHEELRSQSLICMQACLTCSAVLRWSSLEEHRCLMCGRGDV